MPVFTLALIAMNFLAYLLELGVGGDSFCRAHGLIPAAFMRTGDLVPVFESLFLHDPTSVAHILGNMAFLLVFGAVVERSLGHFTFIGLYLTAGVFGGLAHVLVNPSSTDPLVGASGAIFGVLAVAGVLQPRLLGFVVSFVGLNVWHAFFGGGGDVSFGAHLGGFAGGCLVAMMLRMNGNEALEAA